MNWFSELGTSYVTPDSIENMNCLICDTDLVPFNGYHVLYTVIDSSGSLLCENINKVLKRGMDVITARSTFVCKRYLFNVIIHSFKIFLFKFS